MFKQSISFDVWGGDAGKYRLRDNDNNPVENTPEETCARGSKALADLEPGDELTKEHYFKLFQTIMGRRFAGGGRIMANAGAGIYKKETSPINCTVMRQIPDSMDGIMTVAKEAAITLKSGCGVGYDFSPIRPSGAFVFGAGAETSGIISFMKIFDSICSTIMSGGGRRGAQMACLDVSSPEIENFITAKRQDGMLRYFNCSVLVTDAFMEAVEADANWDLWFWEKIVDDNERDAVDRSLVKKIIRGDIPYNYIHENFFSFSENHGEVEFGNCNISDIFKKKVYKTVKAKYIFDLVMRSTYEFWEPGFVFIDRMNIENNLYFCETIRATNPCVTGDTRLSTQYGLVTMKELNEKQLPLNVTVDNRSFDLTSGFGTQTREAKPVFITSNNAEVFKVSTHHGYEVKATAWHEFMTDKGLVKLKDLKIGDKLLIQSGKGQFGTEGSYGLGLVIGLITGDGHFSGERAHLSFWGDDIPLADKLLPIVDQLKNTAKLSENAVRTKYGTSITYVKSRNMCQIKSTLLARLLNDEYHFNAETKLRVPEVIFKGTEECVKGYLQGLFQADGTVSSSCRVSLSSSYLDLLKDIQILLSNFGIVSLISLRRKGAVQLMPDSKGGEKEYFCKDNYDISMTGLNAQRFMEEIGFYGNKNNEKYYECKSKKTSLQFKNNHFETKIYDIQPYGFEMVYDTTQPDKKGIVTSGLVTANCSEQPLSELNSCLLGSMILTEYVKSPFENPSFDFGQFIKDVRIANRLLDNVVEINNLPLPELREQILSKRRHGLGFTGVGSTLNMMNIPYGSPEAIAWLEEVSFVMARESLYENIALAKEKGPAPIFSTKKNRQAVLKSVYLARLINALPDKDQVIQDILEFGLRYSHATSIAPTGTLSLTWGNNCSNGIEPVFSNSYLRNIREAGKKTKTQEEVMDYAYFLWKEKYGDKELPGHWRTTDDLSVNDHIQMQAVAQKWNDSAISKTINVPADYPFEDFKNIYMQGWKLGLKGMTTYRPNATIGAGVLATKSDLEKVEYVFTCEDGSEVVLKGTDSVEYDGEVHNAANLFDALKEGIYGNM